jgi:hypothetical protein
MPKSAQTMRISTLFVPRFPFPAPTYSRLPIEIKLLGFNARSSGDSRFECGYG